MGCSRGLLSLFKLRSTNHLRPIESDIILCWFTGTWASLKNSRLSWKLTLPLSLQLYCHLETEQPEAKSYATAIATSYIQLFFMYDHNFLNMQLVGKM
jgi:hypothetical protein